MQEVTIRIRFTSPCIGFSKKTQGKDVVFCMPRDGQGHVMFLTSWWRDRMQYAAKVANKCYADVGQIDWGTRVDGRLERWRRNIVQAGKPSRRNRYALHEAFRPGAEIGITAVLPASIILNDFIELLGVIGTYKGMSPYQSQQETYGTFDVLSVMPTIRRKDTGV